MTVCVLWLFLKVSLVSLQCLIVVFPDLSHLPFCWNWYGKFSVFTVTKYMYTDTAIMVHEHISKYKYKTMQDIKLHKTKNITIQ